MHRTKKQKNNNRVIDSYIDSKFNKVSDNNYNYVLKPTFPSTLSMNEIIVIKPTSNNQKAKKFPNAFIAYRNALIKENCFRKINLPPMCQLSKIASRYWNKEPENVKDFYRKISEKAKFLYKQNEIQIVFDKHVNEIEGNEQVSRMTNIINIADLDYAQGIEDPVENIIYTRNSTSPIEHTSASVMNSFHDSNAINSLQTGLQLFENKYRMNEVPIDQEDIILFTPPRVDSKFVDNTQGIEEDLVENIIYTQNSTSWYLPIEDDFASVMNSSLGGNAINSSQECFSNCNFFEDPNRMNEIANDQEYIRILECKNVQFSPLRVNTDYVNYTQGIEVPVEDIIFTPNSIDYPTCNIFDQEYGMEHKFTDNQESRQISTCGEDSDYANYEFFPLKT
ncbi:8578_t:CDS:1 [Funneliformis geosporum]|uniref:3308_t:CDS:1 n=1 Tax=Funneliformis geosporum TaxID=1117311 RepID=A0A9W4SA57_9GLOM|nr:3308_t:CDS:1 [Funneliformis geosporum]CAI2165285.1 8578_t:CDS:1 [Funneliformis geosporum]